MKTKHNIGRVDDLRTMNKTIFQSSLSDRITLV